MTDRMRSPVSRATLMTGLHPLAHGAVDNNLPLRQETIGKLLEDSGYHTGYFGKWHLRDEAIAVAGKG
jgi:arylsulfatase A-like enzyme